MKKLYTLDYWVPFPQSEYGGVINVIAENDAECIEILSNEERFYEGYGHLIPRMSSPQINSTWRMTMNLV